MVLGGLVAIAPCTLRNAVGEGRFVLISDAGSRNWEVGRDPTEQGPLACAAGLG